MEQCHVTWYSVTTQGVTVTARRDSSSPVTALLCLPSLGLLVGRGDGSLTLIHGTGARYDTPTLIYSQLFQPCPLHLSP